DIHIVSNLDMNMIDLLQNGGKVILLDSVFFPNLPTTFQPSVAGRTNGNLATVIYDHPLMESFPHDGYCSWQFEPMLEDGNAIVFNDIDIPFDPIIEVVSSFKKVLKQASLFELKVGDGALLVCSLNLKQEDPAGEYMLNLLK